MNGILFKKLKIVEYVTSYRWKYVSALVEGIKSKAIEVVSKKWYYKYNEHLRLELSDINTWSTYEDPRCVDLRFYLKDDILFCDADISDKYYNGEIKGRFKTTLKLPNNFIDLIKESIEYGLEDYAEQQYEAFSAEQKRIWINNFIEKLENGDSFK